MKHIDNLYQSVLWFIDEFEDMPPLINIEEGEEEDFEDDPELIPAGEDETTKPAPIPRKHKETIDYNENIDRWKKKMFQRKIYYISYI